MARRRIVAGNWKLHGDRRFAAELLDAVVATDVSAGVQRIIIPPTPYLAALAERYASHGLEFGAQDVSAHVSGAYTGEVAAPMLVDVGARYCLVGHSERRQYHAETSQQVAAYPELRPYTTAVPPAKAFDQALKAAEKKHRG